MEGKRTSKGCVVPSRDGSKNEFFFLRNRDAIEAKNRIILVPTRDVSSLALVTSDSFPAKSTSVFVFGGHSVNCATFV